MSFYSANLYGYAFSCEVVESYIEAHPRGWAFLLKIYKELSQDTIIRVFRTNQLKWRVFKKLVKLAERLEKIQWADDDWKIHEFLTHVKYYNAYEQLAQEKYGKNKRIVLDRHELQTLEY